ncbi:hypothetical protein G6N05_15050 [Flavobacterium sp. F372]|uniref:Uncharacterized protein n=1 Tax=Flavobacterium bernardetii TaxID=2813823 RepID=A0ABR7J2E4_9FLAO|nr:hypothetical protein [Flavobacterium bernardetii]NHF71429.1 hypothetical protein [Flavobacterium bernardetii]
MFLLLFSSIIAIGQNTTDSDSNILTHICRKGVFEIKYNKEHWQKSNDISKWDVEFHDTHNLVDAYFIEYDYFVSKKNLKSTIKEQYKELGKIKNLKIYDKKINEMNVNYFECELEFNNSTYIFQGFLYNGKGGTMEIQFGVQEEALKQYQAYIDEFCGGIKMIK